MDEHLYDDLVEQIREVSLEVKVVGTEKCFITKRVCNTTSIYMQYVDSTISVRRSLI
jgi:hypothetical protein